MSKRAVSKDEFYAFLKAYPRKLEIDVCGISDPPLVSYNDFNDNKVWPESMVASRFPADDRGLVARYFIHER